MSLAGRFDNTYGQLGKPWVSEVAPSPVPAPRWLAWNSALATRLGWPEDWSQTDQALEALAGNTVFAGSQPVASVYAGHQFGGYNPQLGDGRALLLGEWLTPDGARFDIQLKGAGPTPYSRGGDGRSPVGPVVREYLVSEAMHCLGVPTTRALAAVATGAPVYRNHPEPGAVLTRIASSHLRVGTIQFFAMTQQGEGLAEVIEHATLRHYEDALQQARSGNSNVSYAEVLLTETSKRLAALVAQWQCLGFIHGVLNTDNMLLCGETVDYGPCAFMDDYQSNKVFSSIDTGGRYAYQNQPGIVHWNLSVLAQCLLGEIHPDKDEAVTIAQRIIDEFPQHFSAIHSGLLAGKFGLSHFRENDRKLAEGFFNALEAGQLDFTLAFRWLTEKAQNNTDNTPLPELFTPTPALEAWFDDWQALFKQRGGDHARMEKSNPVVIPRNHLVARAIKAAETEDASVLTTLFDRWQAPYRWSENDQLFAAAPVPEEIVHRTFCGT